MNKLQVSKLVSKIGVYATAKYLRRLGYPLYMARWFILSKGD